MKDRGAWSAAAMGISKSDMTELTEQQLGPGVYWVELALLLADPTSTSLSLASCWPRVARGMGHNHAKRDFVCSLEFLEKKHLAFPFQRNPD